MNKVAVLGLGYVGLPLALALSRQYLVYGVDTDSIYLEKLKSSPVYLTAQQQIHNGKLVVADTLDDKCEADVFIVTVPTPVDSFHVPDLSALKSASAMIGKVLHKGNVVVYESTVYPGCTREICVPVLEAVSGMKLNDGFGVGYSPERINPGDTVHTLETIDKIVSGSDAPTLHIVKELYQSILPHAQVHSVSSIEVAEAAKVIENAQRDINISFMNELALIFDRMNIDTNEVIDAASTKWNFLPFRPGLVGGHCIGVDPYYLTYKSQQLGYSPEVLLSGRRVNNLMPMFIANKVVKLLVQRNKSINGAKVLILGFAFKENCDDFRNTRVADMYREFVDFGADVTIVDPIVDKSLVKKTYRFDILDTIPQEQDYDAIVLAVAHSAFHNIDLTKYVKEKSTVLFDTKNFFPKDMVTGRL
ncbi:MAG: nucleotide sugar dehydrogenase [Chitinophagaceae bacterium]